MLHSKFAPPEIATASIAPRVKEEGVKENQQSKRSWEGAKSLHQIIKHSKKDKKSRGFLTGNVQAQM
jgi:hypothetical protein